MSVRDNIDEIKALIESNEAKHRNVSDGLDDLWEAEVLERECYEAIFEYIDGVGVKIDGIDIRKLLDAVDDEDEGVPEAGVDATFEDITERICNPEHDNPIAAPAAVKQLFAFYYETFWPGQSTY